MKTGLVLEGGGMRGLYTAGVIDAFMDRAWTPDVICGTSAGVTFGINMMSGQRGRVLRYNTRFAGCRDYISLRSLLTTGDMVNTQFAYDRLPNELDPFDYEACERSSIDFYATVTNVNTGQAEYVRIDDCRSQMDVVRASASLPFLSRKVMLNGVPYLDGGISDNIPLDKCRELGCDRIVIVLTHPAGYVKKEDLTGLGRIFYRKDKALRKAFEVRSENYNARLREIEELEKAGKVFVFRPSTHVKVGRLESDPKRLQALYEVGLHDAAALWDQMQDYLLLRP